MIEFAKKWWWAIFLIIVIGWWFMRRNRGKVAAPAVGAPPDTGPVTSPGA